MLRLAPCWVPRSFLEPGRRLKLHPDDLYAFGAYRGGIDERWLASPVEAANEGRTPDEGLSYVVHDGARFTFRDAVAAEGPRIVGPAVWKAHRRWPVFAKFFDNMGPIPMHMHQDDRQARLVRRQAKPEAYYFPPQLNTVTNTFPHSFLGLEPGTSREDIRRCLEDWPKGDNGILDHSKAYRLKAGTGWLIPPRVLHAPGSLVTYEPQWASDVFAIFQSMCGGRCLSWDLLVHDVPKSKRHDLDYLVGLLDWEFNTAADFKRRCHLAPFTAAEGDGWADRWVVYGRVGGKELFSARELTVEPGARAAIRDPGASGVIAVQGRGRIGRHAVVSPAMIRFGTMTEDEVFVTHEAALGGVTFENAGSEPFVTLRYFGPDVWKRHFPDVRGHSQA